MCGVFDFFGKSGILNAKTDRHRRTLKIRRIENMKEALGARVRKLKPILGRGDIAWAVIAATLGGGLFTLLDPAIGRAGAAILVVIALNGLLGLITAIRYAQLSSVLPDVGGGQQWIRLGMGNRWGHTSGWISWLAHSVACCVYAKSLGFYMYQFFFAYLLPKSSFHVGGAQDYWEKGIAGAVIIALAVVNYLGVRFTGRINKWGGIAALSILAVFVALGLLTASSDISASAANFNGFFSYGILGIVSGMGLFYLAFQGPETGAQGGEEARNPKRDVAWGIIVGYLTVWAVIFVVALVAIFAVRGDGVSSDILANTTQGALATASRSFYGGAVLYAVILGAGILVASTALNATLYSSSHAFLALARNQSIPHILERISPRFGTPSFGIGISAVLIFVMTIALPLRDIAAVADVLFMALFAMLHWAFAELKRRSVLKSARAYFPFYRFLYPYSVVLVYVILIIFLWNVSSWGVLIGGAWLAAGWILYNRYTQVEEFREIDSARIRGFFTRRKGIDFKVLCPLVAGAPAVVKEASRLLLLEIGISIARRREKGVKFLYCQSIPQPSGSATAREYGDLSSDERKDFEQNTRAFLDPLGTILDARDDLSSSGEGMVKSDVTEGIMEMVRRDNADVLLMPLEQLRRGRRGFSDLRMVLREVRCDLVVVRVGSDVSIPKKILIPFNRNPHNRLLAETARSFIDSFGAELTFLAVCGPHDTREKLGKLDDELDNVGLEDVFASVILKNVVVKDGDVSGAIIRVAQDYDMILMAAAKGGSLTEIALGETVEAVLAGSNKTTIVVHHHQEIIDPLVAPFVVLLRKGKEFFHAT